MSDSTRDLNVQDAITVAKYTVGDYVSVRQPDNTFFKGTIAKVFEENNLERYFITNKSSGKSIDVGQNDKALKPLFYQNKQGKRVNLRFDEREVAALIKKLKEVEKSTGRKSEFSTLTMKDFTSQKTKTQLLQGKRTSVMNGIVWEKQREVDGVTSTKKMPKEGRFQLYYDKNNDSRLSVNFEAKNLSLTIPEKFYNLEFTDVQKEQLHKDGNLGLVKGLNYANKDTGEIINFDAYIAVDKELNSILARNSKSVNIEKVYGTAVSKKNQKILKTGKGILMDINLSSGKKEMYIELNPSSVSTDGLIKMDKSSAIEKGFLQEEKKKGKDQSLEMTR